MLFSSDNIPPKKKHPHSTMSEQYHRALSLIAIYNPYICAPYERLRASREELHRQLDAIEEIVFQRELFTQEQLPIRTQEQRGPSQDDENGWIQVIHTTSTIAPRLPNVNANANANANANVNMNNALDIDDDDDDFFASFRRIPPVFKEHKKVMAKKKLTQPCPSECSICHETPIYKDAAQTSCNHFYCKDCLFNWMNPRGSSRRCPMCRAFDPKVTTFREREPRKKPQRSNNNHAAVLNIF